MLKQGLLFLQPINNIFQSIFPIEFPEKKYPVYFISIETIRHEKNFYCLHCYGCL